MSGGSQQLRRFRIAYRDHGDLARAADEAGISATEAKLIVAEDAKNPPPPEAFVLLGHNRQENTMSDNIAADQLRLLIERIERLEEEKKGISDDIKDVYSEAKATGFDTKTMRTIIRERKMEKHARDEAEALLDTYREALGMLTGTPLGDHVMRTAMERTADAVNAGALGPAITATFHSGSSVDDDALYDEAKALVINNGKASASWLQRQLRIGYNPAARMIERMEREGVVSAPNHVGARTVRHAEAVAA